MRRTFSLCLIFAHLIASPSYAFAPNCQEKKGTTRACCLPDQSISEPVLFTQNWNEVRCAILDKDFYGIDEYARSIGFGKEAQKCIQFYVQGNEYRHRKLTVDFDDQLIAFEASIPCDKDNDDVFFDGRGGKHLTLWSSQQGVRRIYLDANAVDFSEFATQRQAMHGSCPSHKNFVVVVVGRTKEHNRYYPKKSPLVISYEIEIVDLEFTGVERNPAAEIAEFWAGATPLGRWGTAIKILHEGIEANNDKKCVLRPRIIPLGP